MKRFKIFFILLLLVGASVFSGCIDWLDVEPKDKVLKDKQFSTELRTNSTLNGLYRAMADNSLYGRLLTQTYIAYLAGYYDYWDSAAGPVPTALREWTEVAEYNYHADRVKQKSQAIWNKAYETILETNIFIKDVEERDDVMLPSRKNVILGEAYALRAFLHFDLFRLFGPIYNINLDDFNPNTLSIPYNDLHVPATHPRETASEFLELVLKDLATAEKLLENDPIRTTGRNDNYEEIRNDFTLTSEIIFAEFYRNRRMNYYAVKALQARVLLQKGEYSQAALAAQTLQEEIFAKNVFHWTPPSLVVLNADYVFCNEVLFGLNNLTLHSGWTALFGGTLAGNTHVVVQGNLYQNFFAEYNGAELSAISDVRGRMWQQSDIAGGSGSEGGMTFTSRKFRTPAGDDWKFRPYFLDFQPLIRLSELYLIRAEAAIANNDAATAAAMVNEVMSRRGVQSVELLDPVAATIEDVQVRLEREYYRDFVGEGQAFFYLKRNAKTRRFAGFRSGHINLTDIRGVNTLRNAYVVPLPDSETIID